MAQDVQPIWKDLKYTYPSTPAPAYVDYILRRDSAAGSIIYTGRAYKRPGETYLAFSVNSVVADYLRNDFPFSIIPAAQPANNYGRSISCDAGLSVWISVKPAGSASYGSFEELGYYQNDWSYYDGTYYRQIPGLQDDVSTWGPRSVTFLKTGLDSISTAERDPDRMVDVRMPVIFTYGDPYTNTFRNSVTWVGEGAVRVGNILQPDGVYGSYVQAVQTCHRYVLYFLSAWGGWSFVYLDAVKPEESYDRKTAKRLYDSSNLKERGIVNYVNEITKRWTAKTPYFDDEQSSKVWHIAGTTVAYLFDMETGTWTPVNVENASWDGKTYRNQGGKRVRYDINFTLAQDRLRRL